MRLMTWNINGLRSFKIPLKSLLDGLNCDIICFQETKVTREHLEEHLAIVEGYNSYFSYSKVKSGYSGVATFVKDECTPWLAEEGLSNIGKKDSEYSAFVGHYGTVEGFSEDELNKLDSEGRCIMTEHEIINAAGETRRLVIINVYCPRADPDNEERVAFKINFYRLLQSRAEEILKSGKNVIILGDINTCHRPIDHCNLPKEDSDFQSDPGRQWMNSFVLDPLLLPVTDHNDDESRRKTHNLRFVDILRLFHPRTRNLFTNWCSSTGARATNFGSRIDYIFADRALALDDKLFGSCSVCPDIMGSDHCPVVADLSCVVLSAMRCPPICTKYLPQFFGRQQKLSNFFMSMGENRSLVRALEQNKLPHDVKNLGLSSGQLPKKRSASTPLDGRTDKKQTRENSMNNKPLNARNIMKYFSGDSALISRTNSDEGHVQLQHEDLEDRANIIDSNPASSQSCSSCSLDVTPLSSQEETSDPASDCQKRLWGSILKGPPKAPLCKGHGEPCTLRSVKKSGPNQGRSFWVCSRPEGHRTNREARCDHFTWIK